MEIIQLFQHPEGVVTRDQAAAAEDLGPAVWVRTAAPMRIYKLIIAHFSLFLILFPQKPSVFQRILPFFLKNCPQFCKATGRSLFTIHFRWISGRGIIL